VSRTSEPKSPWLVLIAVLKLVKAAVLMLVAVGLGDIVARGPEKALVPWLEAVHFDARGKMAHQVVARIFSLDDAHLEGLAVATVAYACVFAVEGIGLLLRKRWAEYLTLAVTVSFLPLEIFELVRHHSVPKWFTLVVNVAVVAYLAARAVHRHREDHAHREPGALRMNDRSIARSRYSGT
jgi:uncharacterized membrane protein (DUF2068 family)